MHELSTLTLYCHCQRMRRTYPCSAFYEAQVERAHLFQEQSLVHLNHQGLTALRTAWLLQCSSYSSANSYRDSVKYKWCYGTHGSVNKYARHAAKHRHREKRFREKIRICLESPWKHISRHRLVMLNFIQGLQKAIYSLFRQIWNQHSPLHTFQGNRLTYVSRFYFVCLLPKFPDSTRMFWEGTSSIQILFYY